VLTKDHLDALKNFKNYVSANVQNKTSNTQRIAFVLPQDYGWGLRNINDRIWGVWPADDKSSGIWNQITNLTQTYGNNFDIIYDSLWTRLFAKTHYNELVWWNSTSIVEG
jgi:UDP-N-acetylmuramoylalanine-D-glutamate ligase